MGSISLKSFVELPHESVDTVLHHVNLANEGRGLVGIEFIAARSFRQSVVKERLHDHILRKPLLFQAFASSIERAVRKFAILAWKDITEGTVVVRIGHSSSISYRRTQKQISSVRMEPSHGR